MNKTNRKRGAGWARGGALRSPEYRSYAHAKSRCNCTTDAAYERYGGRGIKFLFTSFAQFISDVGPRPQGKTLDRIDNNGNYEPGNVRWATHSEQMKNRRMTPRLRASLAAKASAAANALWAKRKRG